MGDRVDYVDKHLGSLEDFVRGSSKYYLEAWRSERIKFNFAAFLFEALWFAYRKMYTWAIVLVIVNISINLLTILVLIKTKFYMIGMILALIIRVFIGFKANDIYYNKAKKVLQRCEFEPEDKDCGTSLLGVVLLAFLAIVFQVLLDFYLGITLYY